MTDWQAAIGVAQIDKLPHFCTRRKENFRKWTEIFSNYAEYFVLPQKTEWSDPAWFAFIITLKDDAPFSRDELTLHLNSKLIETRNLFGGNLTKQPGFIDKIWKVAEHLRNTDRIVDKTFFLGTYPGLTDEMFSYAQHVLSDFLKNYK
jgi:CDP-6-deoxy-D-xylo-4-hexulose-3-dehydrase